MTKQFTIKIQDVVFTSNEDGMLNLNEIHKEFNLPKSKRPNQWRSQISEYLFEAANLQSLKIKGLGSNLDYSFIAGDEKATIAYAMWVDVGFYDKVIEAFVALRNGEFEKATEIAMSTMSEADAHYLKRQAKLKGMFWDEACAFAGIKSPRLLKKYLNKNSNFFYFDKQGNVADNDRAEELFYNRGNKFTSTVRLCVTPEGRDWLRTNRDFFNEKAESMRKH